MGKRRSENYRRKYAGEQKTFSGQARAWIANIYLLLMLGVYPLLQVDGYMDLVYKKWAMLLRVTVAAVVVSLLCFLGGYISGLGKASGVAARGGKGAGVRERKKTDWMLVDWFVAGYFICVLISYLCAADRQASFFVRTFAYFAQSGRLRYPLAAEISFRASEISKQAAGFFFVRTFAYFAQSGSRRTLF